MVNSIIDMALSPTRNSYCDLQEIQQARQAEHRENNAKTALGVGLAVGLPAAAGYAVYKNPDNVEVLLTKYGTKADKMIIFIKDKAVGIAKKADELIKKNAPKVTKKVSDIYNKTGFVEKLKTAIFATSIKDTKAYDAASKVVKDFMLKTPAQKGKIALIATGAVFVVSTVVNLIRNHDYEAGKIDQKYEDMKRNNPIIDAKTDDIISKEKYEKMMNTYLN